MFYSKLSTEVGKKNYFLRHIVNQTYNFLSVGVETRRADSEFISIWLKDDSKFVFDRYE